MDLVYDSFTQCFGTLNEFRLFIEQVESKSWWREIPIKAMNFGALQNIGIYAQQYAEDYLCSLPSIEDTMGHSKLMLLIGDEAFPMRDTALSSLLERLRIGGKIFKILPAKDKADILLKCAQALHGRAKLYYSGEKITAVPGPGYVVLSMSTIFDTTDQYLQQAFKGTIFTNATYSHEKATAAWTLPKVDGEAKLKYQNALVRLGMEVPELVPTLLVTTSNTGNNAVTLTPSIQSIGARGNMRLCPEIKMEHKGKASIQQHEENLKGIFNKISQSVDKLIDLVSITLEYPTNTMMAVLKKVGIPKKYGILVVEKYRKIYGDKPLNAYSLFSDAFDCIGYMRDDPKETDATGTAIEFEERLGKIPFMNLCNYDLPGVVNW